MLISLSNWIWSSELKEPSGEQTKGFQEQTLTSPVVQEDQHLDKTWIFQSIERHIVFLLSHNKEDTFVLFSIIYQNLFIHTKTVYLHCWFICLHMFIVPYLYLMTVEANLAFCLFFRD